MYKIIFDNCPTMKSLSILLIFISIAISSYSQIIFDDVGVIVRGHRAGQFYFTGPSDSSGYALMRSDDYCRSIAEIPIHDMTVHCFYRDAGEGNLYSLLIYPHGEDRWFGRTTDGGESWERIEAGHFVPPTTGRIAGEVYGLRSFDDVLLYSTDYTESYEEIYYGHDYSPHHRTIGHIEGEIFNRNQSGLWRSRNFGRDWDLIFESNAEISIGSNHAILRPGPERAELYHFPTVDHEGGHLSYSDDGGESFTRIASVWPPPTDYYPNWLCSMEPGTTPGVIVIAFRGYDLHRQHTMIISYVTRDYGESWEYYETINTGPWHWDQVSVNKDSYPETSSPPETISFLTCYPNPFNQNTRIIIDLIETQFIKIEIIDITGGIIDVPFTGILNKGSHSFEWSLPSPSISSGFYFCRAIVKNQIYKQNLILLR